MLIYLSEKKNNTFYLIHDARTGTSIYKASNVLIKHSERLQRLWQEKLVFLFRKLKVRSIGLVVTSGPMAPQLRFAVKRFLRITGVTLSIVRIDSTLLFNGGSLSLRK